MNHGLQLMPAKAKDLANAFFENALAAASTKWGLSLINLALAAALAALLAAWTWRLAELFAGPGPAAPAIQHDGADLEGLKAMHLFGKAGPGDAGAAPESEMARTSLDIKLRGVFAGGGAPAFAILAVDGKDEAFSVGAQVMPGVVLEAVAADHVRLLNNGAPEKLALDNLGRSLEKIQKAISISANDIGALLANVQNIGFELRQPPGGQRQLILTKATSEVEKLGLQNGDILQLVNGVRIDNVEDLNRQLAVSAASQEIALVGERNGQSMNLTYKVQR